MRTRLPWIAIYPREGTETSLPNSFSQLSTIAIYPREGTETRMCRAYKSRSQHCNLSPRGDGNSAAHAAEHITLIIAIYPREGTETR